MSRLAKKPIIIPDGVKVNYASGVFSTEGKQGKLQQMVQPALVEVNVEEKKIMVIRKGEGKNFRTSQGLYWALLRNMIEGVINGFSKNLVIQGLGYKWEMKGKNLVITCGFSNPVIFEVPQGVTITVDSITSLKVTGADKQLVGEVAAKIRDIKPPEPYKGKGIRYQNETVKLKEGKSAK
jgi:large subunit ribosomal protein L6